MSPFLSHETCEVRAEERGGLTLSFLTAVIWAPLLYGNIWLAKLEHPSSWFVDAQMVAIYLGNVFVFASFGWLMGRYRRGSIALGFPMLLLMVIMIAPVIGLSLVFRGIWCWTIVVNIITKWDNMLYILLMIALYALGGLRGMGRRRLCLSLKT